MISNISLSEPAFTLLKEKLRHVSELKATFAMWNASGSNDLDALIRAIDGILSEYKDEIAKRKDADY